MRTQRGAVSWTRSAESRLAAPIARRRWRSWWRSSLPSAPHQSTGQSWSSTAAPSLRRDRRGTTAGGRGGVGLTIALLLRGPAEAAGDELKEDIRRRPECWGLVCCKRRLGRQALPSRNDAARTAIAP